MCVNMCIDMRIDGHTYRHVSRHMYRHGCRHCRRAHMPGQLGAWRTKSRDPSARSEVSSAVAAAHLGIDTCLLICAGHAYKRRAERGGGALECRCRRARRAPCTHVYTHVYAHVYIHFYMHVYTMTPDEAHEQPSLFTFIWYASMVRQQQGRRHALHTVHARTSGGGCSGKQLVIGEAQ